MDPELHDTLSALSCPLMDDLDKFANLEEVPSDLYVQLKSWLKKQQLHVNNKQPTTDADDEGEEGPGGQRSSREEWVHNRAGLILAHRLLNHRRQQNNNASNQQNGSQKTDNQKPSSITTKKQAASGDELLTDIVNLLSVPVKSSSAPQEVISAIQTVVKKKFPTPEPPVYDFEGLTPDEWKRLDTLATQLQSEVESRSVVLVKRCQTTIDSFKLKRGLSASAKNQLSSIQEWVRDVAAGLTVVTVGEAMGVRHSDVNILLNAIVSGTHKTCSIRDPNGRTNAPIDLHKYVIPPVPDRGGRTEETRAPKNEKFWEQKRGGFGHGGFKGRGGGGHRGGGGGGGGGRGRGGFRGRGGGGRRY